MKCEDPGYHTRDTIQVIEPGALTEFMQKRIEEFRFPLDEYPIPEEREKELAYDRMYIPRSVYVIHYSPLDPTAFMAVARIIEKRRPEDKLPLEFSTVVSTTVDSTTSPKRDINGGPFPVDYYDARLPVCEIGGLRAAKVDLQKGITPEARCNALKELIVQCDKEVHKREYASYFLACTGTRHMERLYNDKCYFNEVATISFGKGRNWKALWRDPANDPQKDIVAKKLSSIQNERPGLPWKPTGISTCILPRDEYETVHKRQLELVC